MLSWQVRGSPKLLSLGEWKNQEHTSGPKGQCFAGLVYGLKPLRENSSVKGTAFRPYI